MVDPVLPSVAELQPELKKLEGPPGSLLFIAVEPPEGTLRVVIALRTLQARREAHKCS